MRLQDWRVFVGRWDDGYIESSSTNQTFDDYGAARAELVRRLEMIRRDDCEPCSNQAAKELDRLSSLPEGCEFAGWVDSVDYLLIRADRMETDDLEVMP